MLIEKNFEPQKGKIPETISKEKKPHFISSKLLKALGGIKETTPVGGSVVDKGAYLWGVEDREKGAGIFRHVLLASRIAYVVAKELKEKGISEYQNIDLKLVVEAALLHDIAKLYGEDREKLPTEVKEAMGLGSGFREISDETNAAGASWLKDLGFSPEVYEVIAEHGFPTEMPKSPYAKIILLADFMTGQKIMPVEDRLNDVKTRWIDQKVAKGESPRIEPELFDRAREVIKKTAQEIFQFLEINDKEFIESHKLNNNESTQRWEKFLGQTRKEEKEGRASRLVDKYIK